MKNHDRYESQQVLSLEAQKLIRIIKIRVKRAVKSGLLSNTKSLSRGTGFDFDHLRNYYPGDDVRFIDWKAVGRLQAVTVRQYKDDRSRLMLIAVDVSASTLFSSGVMYKPDLLAQMAAIIALVANYSGDRVGLVLFSDELELYIPPLSGVAHVQKIVEAIFKHKSNKKNTNVEVLRKVLVQLRTKDIFLFLISDGILTEGVGFISLLARMCHLIMVRCLDKIEMVVPSGGFLEMIDIETNSVALVDLRSSGVLRINKYLSNRLIEQDRMLKSLGVPCLSVNTHSALVRDTILFFNNTVI